METNTTNQIDLIIKFLLHDLKSLNNSAKPLGQKNQEKCRAFMHKLYAPYLNSVATKIIDEDFNEQQLRNQTQKFSEIANEKIFEQVKNSVQHFVEKGKNDLAERVPKTFFVSAKKVLENDFSQIKTLQKTQKTTENNQKTLVF